MSSIIGRIWFSTIGKAKLSFSSSTLLLVGFVLLILLYISQLHSIQPYLNPCFVNVLAHIKDFLFKWILPFLTLIIALLAYENIFLTKSSVLISQNTLKQLQFADQKTTSPMLKFDLAVGEVKISAKIKDEDRPREIVLWDSKASSEEKLKSHYLNLCLKNMQEHPNGVAISCSITIDITLPKYEDKKGTEVTETIAFNFSFFDPKEQYEQSIIRISGIPHLKAKIKSVSYKDMFERQYVIGYGTGVLDMVDGYKFSRFFLSLSGQSPDQPSV